jgi:tetratricopeptide (TPR) repeat protein
MMNLNRRNTLKEYNLLSIGQRGVGKTVFLAGSYLEINASSRQINEQKFEIESSQSQAKDNLKSVIAYIASTGLYPPPTLKISEFTFLLKRHTIWGKQNLCRFNWWDLPGEFCELTHPEFQKIALDSHSCCIFINAYELVNNVNYLPKLEKIINQGMAIAGLINQEDSEYNFALIFTQCDRLETGLLSQLQIEEQIQPLIERLQKTSAKYKRFYSAIPIRGEIGNYYLEPKGAAASLLWLTSQLIGSNSEVLAQNLEKTQKLEFNPSLSQQKFLNSRWLLSLAVVVVFGAISGFYWAYNRFFSTPQAATTQTNQSQPGNFNTLVEQANQYIEEGNLNQALPLIEQIVQQQPNNLNWQLNLAKIYELQENKTQAEAVYDRILQQEAKNLSALIGKAILRSEQGDTNSAKNLLQQAEQFAPTAELKTQIRAIAKSLL